MGQHPHTIAVIGALAGAAAILVFLILGSGVPPPRAPGVVHTTEIKIAPEISGRLSQFAVTQGQRVRKGDELVELVSPELSASLVLANAELGAARAARDRVYAGTRQEQVGMLEREIETAGADLLYAEQQFARQSKLAADGFASRQDLDQAFAAVAPSAQGASTRKRPTRPRGWGRSAKSWRSPMPRCRTPQRPCPSSPPASKSCASARRRTGPSR